MKRAVQVALALLGLTGLVDNIVVWHEFVSNILVDYHYIRDVVFDVLPFVVSDVVKDFTIVGIAVASSFHAAIMKDLFWELDRTKSAHWLVRSLMAIYAHFYAFFQLSLWQFFFWPFTLFWAAVAVVFKRGSRPMAEPHDPPNGDLLLEGVLVGMWPRLGWTVIFFIGFLFLFSDVLSRIGLT